MGGAVSSGRNNNELIDNLVGGNYIRSRNVERVFRALDRADYMTPESRDQAYKDLAWRNGHLHMSSPCIYSEVMEGLELKPGLSFLNVGSGTGYLSTLAGLILGSGGISHGIEVHSSVVDYANKKLGQFLANSPTVDEFDFCEPKFFVGNGLCLPPQQPPYDRVYCGAGCPDEYENYFNRLIKVGGVLVMPLSDSLVQVRRVAKDQWVKQNLFTVSFAKLREPLKEDALNYVRLEEQAPPPLQTLARGVVRGEMRLGVMRRSPELREPAPRPAPRRAPPAPVAAVVACPRRIRIPIERGRAFEGLNILHDLDDETGADEMNALLSLIIRMDQNRVAGAIRFDRIDSSQSESTSNSEQSSDEGGPSDQPSADRVFRSRRSQSTRETSDTGRSDEGRSTLSNSKTDEPDSGSSSSSTRSKNVRKSKRDRSDSDSRSKAKNGRKSDRDRSEHDRRSKEDNGSKSDTHSSELDKTTKRDSKSHTSSDDSSSSDKSRRRSNRDSSDNSRSRKDKGRRGQSGTARRSGSSGSLLAFEFQATERNPQPTTSSGSARSPDTSASTSENGGGNKNKNKKSSRRPPCKACNPVKGVIPAEVKLCLRDDKVGRTRYFATQSGTVVLGGDWGENNTDTEEVLESSNDEKEVEKTESTSKNKAKRQKLDSGIGENTPSSSSPSPRLKSNTDESDTDERPTDSVTDEAEPAPEAASRRRVHKRSRVAASEGASTSSSSAEEAAGAAGEGAVASEGGVAAERGVAGAGRGAGVVRPRGARRHNDDARPPSDDARRVRLSLRMKRAVNELPLPYLLKKFVNLNRCFHLRQV